MSYANKTSVPVVRSQEEIRKTLERYKATGFVFGENNGMALCGFEMNNRRIKFIIEIPIYGKAKTKKNYLMGDAECAQVIRTRWRCLLLAIKAKFECVESGISTFEEEFLAHIVVPDGSTIGQKILPQIAESYHTGIMPPLLGGRV